MFILLLHKNLLFLRNNSFLRIRQLGEKQKIKEKSRERENPNGDSTKDLKDSKSSKIPTKASESRVPPSQVTF